MSWQPARVAKGRRREVGRTDAAAVRGTPAEEALAPSGEAGRLRSRMELTPQRAIEIAEQVQRIAPEAHFGVTLFHDDEAEGAPSASRVSATLHVPDIAGLIEQLKAVEARDHVPELLAGVGSPSTEPKNVRGWLRLHPLTT